MKNILVFCSANDLEEKYVISAREFAELIPKNGYGLIWGGSDTGIMKLMASTVQENGGKIVGVSMELLKVKARVGADEMIIARDLSERQQVMLDRCDAIVALPGGIGTLNEITAVLEMKKHKTHDKPIVVLNSDNFFEGLKVQMQKMEDDGFLPRPLEEMIFFADKPEEVFEYVEGKIKL
ncbi:MAG: TIGR00730 family Rossman fold protein [bacterium]|nr:TIGR00730 family Rossman fold protein [bacterium]